MARDQEAIGDLNQQFVIVDVDKSVVAALQNKESDGFAGKFESKAPPASLRIAVGDVLQIGVVEAGAGLFGQGNAAQAGSTTLGGQGLGATAAALQPVQVDKDGKISVPFAGHVVAAGRTVDQVRANIESLLADKAVNPQVEVLTLSSANPSFMSSANPTYNSATVGGQVNHAGVFALRPSGSRLLDVIADAAAEKYPAYEITVHVTRKGRTATASLQNVVDNPSENIFIYPGDNIYLSHDPRTFTVLGASSKVGRYPFDTERVNLAEAVAEAGGFVDQVADPGGVFLFRYESPEVVAAIRPEQSRPSNANVPVVYRLNLRDGDGYFLAQQFAMRDKDVVLLANADGTQVLKALAVVRGVTGVVSDLHATTGPAPATASHF